MDMKRIFLSSNPGDKAIKEVGDIIEMTDEEFDIFKDIVIKKYGVFCDNTVAKFFKDRIEEMAKEMGFKSVKEAVNAAKKEKRDDL